MSGSDTLLLRADATAKGGIGHFMRCYALGQAWSEQGGEVIVVTFCDDDGLLARLREDGFETVPIRKPHPDPADWKALNQTLTEANPAWVTLDGYHFDSIYHGLVRRAGPPLLVIDDIAHLPAYETDILLNQNAHAKMLSYPLVAPARLLLGTDYVLLRREFRRASTEDFRIEGTGKRLLITLGGSDQRSLIARVISALGHVDVPDLETRILIWPRHSKLEDLEALAAKSPCRVQLTLQPTEIVSLMRWADLALTAGGTTCWELAFVGTPFVTVVLAENQVGIANSLAEANVSVNVGWLKDLDPEDLGNTLGRLLANADARRSISGAGRSMVDGRGAERVLTAMRDIGAA